MEECRVPFLTNQVVLKKADLFTNTYNNPIQIPVPIEEIMEQKLNLAIIPVPDFKKVRNLECFIGADFTAVTIDQNIFDNDINRTRFSLTHEVSHFILHKEIYQKYNILNVDKYVSFMNSITNDELKKLEIQANIFAGHVLVPNVAMIEEIEKVKYQKGSLEKMSFVEFKDFMEYLGERFQVSDSALLTQIKYNHKELYTQILKYQVG